MSIFPHCATAERIGANLKNVISRRADEEHHISPYNGDVPTVKVLRYDVVLPGAEIQRCFAQPSLYRLPVLIKDDQYVYFKHGSEKK